IHFFFFSSRGRHTRFSRDWSSDVCSSDLKARTKPQGPPPKRPPPGLLRRPAGVRRPRPPAPRLRIPRPPAPGPRQVRPRALPLPPATRRCPGGYTRLRSEEHTSELQSRENL